MPATWVVVADSAAARIFLAGSPTGALDEVESYAHAEGRAHDRDLRTDDPGRAFDSVGNGRHAMESKVTPKTQEVITFARQIADRISSARKNNTIDRAILVAPPEFLGHLRSALDEETRRIVEGEYALNVVRMRPEEIRGHLPEKLYSALAARG